MHFSFWKTFNNINPEFLRYSFNPLSDIFIVLDPEKVPRSFATHASLCLTLPFYKQNQN